RAAALVESDDAMRAARYLLSASDNLRCSGRFARGYAQMRRGIRMGERDPAIAALAGTKSLLFLRHVYQIARLIPWLQPPLQRRARRIIEHVRRGLLDAGEYFDFQQLALWTRRFGLEHD